MCGIAGIVDWGHRDEGTLREAARRMEDALAPRGPDGRGEAVVAARTGGATAYLVHRRLAVIDLSDGGRQPRASADGRHWVTYNGEIYNYRELQAQPSLADVTWTSTSDTEVLVEGLARHGVSLLPDVRGMFACAWWHTPDGRLTLCRDRFGIKPLVWARVAPDLLLFASTPQALAASGLVSLRPTAPGRADFLARGSVAETVGYWEGVHAVPAGYRVTFDRDGADAQPWVSEPKWTTPARVERSAAEVGQLVEAALRDSVRAHFVSDVPVALFLSGGRDSVALLAAARALGDVPLKSFTVTMRDVGLDEATGARAAARYFGADHIELPLADLDLDALLEEFFQAMASPSVDGFNTFVVARAASQAGIRVALSGVGGDELFGGYPSFTEVSRVHRLLTLGGPWLRTVAPAMARGSWHRAARLAEVALESPQSLEEVWWHYRALWPNRWVAAFAGVPGPSCPVRFEGEVAAFDAVRACEWQQFLQRQLLPDADAFTMCHGLELRTPMVDHELLAAVLQAGHWSRGNAPTFKQALFEAMPSLTVPELRDAPKKGFVLPFDRWLRRALSPQPTQWADVAERLGRAVYRKPVEQFLSGRLHWTRIWALYVEERLRSAA